MNATNPKKDLSYFQLRLLELLNQSYPELAKDIDFIEARSELALEAYTNAIVSKYTHLEASHIANQVLFSDLPFSKMDLLFNIVCTEFNRDIKDEKLRGFAEKMYSITLPVFNQYHLDANFEENEMYDALYTELTGTIQLWMDESLLIK